MKYKVIKADPDWAFWCSDMDACVGNTYKFDSVDSDGNIVLNCGERSWAFPPRCVEFVTDEKQVKQSKPGEWVEPYEGMRIRFTGEKLPLDCSYDTVYELMVDDENGDFYIVDDAGDYNSTVEGRECWEHYGVVVVEDDQPSAKLDDIVSVSVAEAAPIKSDGGSSAYYQKQIIRLVDGAVFECQTGDIIRSMVANDFDGGNILKALDRIFQNIQGKGKDGVSIEYDCNKIIYFAEIIKQRYAGK